jgi:dUTP pyrophosphatase
MRSSALLNGEEIRRLIEEKALITDYIDLETQLQPAGFDLSLGEVYEYVDVGCVDFSNIERKLPEIKPLKPDERGWYNLPAGCYLIVYNEAVKIPLDVAAIARSRSTLLRCGASIETAVWDPGYEGRSSSLLVVHNPEGIRLKRNARVTQLLFLKTSRVEEGYRGVYQRERIEG